MNSQKYLNNMIIPITPVSKPRQTKSDVWKKRPVVMKYRKFADELRAFCKKHNFVPGEELEMEFHIPMPKSWSKKKKAEMEGKPNRSRPDSDNLAKAVLDALLPEDSTVWSLNIIKRWSREGYIDLRNKYERHTI